MLVDAAPENSVYVCISNVTAKNCVNALPRMRQNFEREDITIVS
jgi:hypothetical protein